MNWISGKKRTGTCRKPPTSSRFQCFVSLLHTGVSPYDLPGCKGCQRQYVFIVLMYAKSDDSLANVCIIFMFANKLREIFVRARNFFSCIPHISCRDCRAGTEIVVYLYSVWRLANAGRPPNLI